MDRTLDAAFKALADPTRRAILTRLARGQASVSELAEPFAMSLPAVSKHLKVLRRAGLISQGREAQQRPCRLETAPWREIASFTDRLGQLAGAGSTQHAANEVLVQRSNE